MHTNKDINQRYTLIHVAFNLFDFIFVCSLLSDDRGINNQVFCLSRAKKWHKQ